MSPIAAALAIGITVILVMITLVGAAICDGLADIAKAIRETRKP